jgi:uncharacterized Tic20 family protein
MNDPTPDPAATASTATAAPDADQRTWALFAHLSILAGAAITGGWAFSIGSFLGPLIIWIVKKDTMPFVNDQAKEALNFAITLAIIGFALLMLTLLSLGIAAILTVPLFLVVGVTAVILVIVAAVKANEGVAYRYPFTIRLVK